MKNTSKKKRYTKKYRKGSSSQWIRDFEGKNIVEAYSKWYGVDLLCAIKELRIKGIVIEEAYERKARQKVEAKRKERQISKENRKKNKTNKQDEFSDDRFAYIVGYTSGGAAYGLTHKEMQEAEELEKELEELEKKIGELEKELGEDFEEIFKI